MTAEEVLRSGTLEGAGLNRRPQEIGAVPGITALVLGVKFCCAYEVGRSSL
jgi:hypothetical protein